MSARCKNLVKLAIAVNQEQNIEPISSLTLFSKAQNTEDQENNPNVYNVEQLVDAGLVFENQPSQANSDLSAYFSTEYSNKNVLAIDDVQHPVITELHCFDVANINDLNPITNYEHKTASTSVTVLTPVSLSSVPSYDNQLDSAESYYDNSDPDYVANVDEIDEDGEDEDEDEKHEELHNNSLQEDAEIIQEEQTESKRKDTSKKRFKRARPETWKRNENKIKRMKGQAYLGFTRDKDGKVSQNKQRPSRNLVTCDSDRCLKNRSYCSSISKEDSEKLFTNFWSLSWPEKKGYVLSLVDKIAKKRSYTAGPSRRSFTFIYQLKRNNEKLRVCKRMFLGTLGLKEKMVHSWIKNSPEAVENVSKIADRQYSQKNDLRRSHLKSFFDALPKQPSHYCRKDSSKVYLEQSFKTKSQLYDLYKEKCQLDEMDPYTLYPFSCMFDDLNLSIFQPRKDECDVCYSFKIKQINEEVYNNHVQRKNVARAEKTKNKEEAMQNKVYTFTMDTQAVKLCPLLNVGASYYKTKVQLHNFTVYNLESHQCVNYLWNETEGDMSASVFATCITRHIQENCLADIKPIILFSDGCCYQNRNTILSNALLHLSVDHNVVIEQKYLEKGHTQMECDSVHALIERKMKNRIIQLPSEYISVIRESRKKPTPLDVCYLTHEDFLNFDEKHSFIYNSIRPGRGVNDPTVTELRALKYTPDGKIFYKINFDSDYEELPQRNKQANIKSFKFEKLFKERLKIKNSKWLHLQQLKGYLTTDTHGFYDSLPHLTS